MAQTFPKFLELPAEIRLKIYYHALVMDKPILPNEVQPLGILRTCRLVYKEASEKTYYQHNTFIVGDSVPKETKWLARIGDKRRQMIRKVEVRDAPKKSLGLKIFNLLSQCSNLSLTMEIPMRPLALYLQEGNMANFHGVPKVTIEVLCKDRETKFQRALWNYWLEELEEVKAHMESICAPTCLFHVNKARLGPESAVHLRITHCCRQEHCCHDSFFDSPLD